MADTIPISNLDVVREIVEKHRDDPGCLMPILQETQEKYGYLPLELQQEIADGLDIPLTEVYGVSTFYSQFTLKPKGEHKIGVCLGTACYVRGSQAILDEVSDILNVKVGDTTEDGKFSLDATRCVGACGLAPVMMINEDVYGRLTPAQVVPILDMYK